MKRAPPDQSVSTAWERWFDTKRTSIAMALSALKIDIDPDAKNVDLDDPVRFERFILRPKQKACLDMAEGYFWRRKQRAARLVVLKSRRYGMTTFLILFGLERILRVAGYRVALVAQDDVMAKTHFQKLRDTFVQIPKDVLKERGIEVVRDTDQQLILRHQGFKTSEFRVAPAKRNALGRGDRYNMLLLTEYPVWPKSARTDLSGVLRACRDVPGNLIMFESTARGYDEFWRRYARAAKRKSAYRAVFIGSHEHPGNRKKFESMEAEAAFIESIGKEPEFGAEDELVLFRRLTVDLKWPLADVAAFLNWRRATITDDCEGVVSNFKREEPTTPEEAFQGTGLPLFRKDILDGWRPFAEAREEKAEVLRLLLRGPEIDAVPEIQRDFVVLARPEPGTLYGFGADVASGKTRLADGRTEADFSVMNVKEVRTKITVARFRMHIPPTEYARAVFRVACWYNGARGYIERAINDAGVCIDRFEDEEWGGISGRDLLLTQKRLIKTDFTNVRANYHYIPGFQTTPKTKPQLVDRIHALVRDTGVPDGKKPCPWDLLTLDEAMKFERVEGSTAMEASEGHDDCVMAEGLALEACERILEEGLSVGDIPAPIKKGSHMALLRHAAAVASQGSDDVETGFVSPPGMPGF